ncbi:radical SAM/SPASM domain-containing protein [Clostridium rectalis]|uniref:radical SAM/SPASM domain-containing protein n=1 Tax=Clostridium rectalis TaxID=2040295 RepID=UPI000F63758E|nr:radical SAM protein [Clostridium rectalis]
MNVLPTDASFIMTTNCNNRCKYCFVHKFGHEVIKDEVITDGIDYLLNNAKKAGKKSINISIFGGEPTLVPEKIDILLTHAFKRQNETGIQCQIGLITNGVYVSEKLKKLIIKYKDKLNFGVQLSCDGNRETHDMYRVRENGEGSFKYVEKNIKIYKELFKDSPQQFSVHGCLNKQSLPHLFENYKFFREGCGIERIWFMPVHEEQWDINDVGIYREQLKKISDYILDDMIKNKRIDELKNFSPLSKLLEGRSWVNPPCNAGKTYISIIPNGDIYPCHHFYFNDFKGEMRIGSLYEGIDDEKRKPFLKLKNEEMEGCGQCECYNCYRCLGANYMVNGDIKKQIRGHYCEMAHVEHEICEYMKEKATELSLYQDKNSVASFTIDESLDVLAQAMKVLFIEVDEMKTNQKQIIKNQNEMLKIIKG